MSSRLCSTCRQNPPAGKRGGRCEACIRSVAAGVGAEPLEPYPGHTKARWKLRCTRCGADFETIFNALDNGSGCPACGRRRAAESLRLDPAEARRRLIAAGFRPDPTVAYPGQTTPWPGVWIACGHRHDTVLPSNITSGSSHCATCARLATSARLRMPDAEAREVAEAWGYTPDPKVAFPGSQHKWPGRCRSGHDCAPQLGSRFSNEGPCKTCGDIAAGLMQRLDEDVARTRAADAGFIPDPSAVYPGRDQLWPGRCGDCGESCAARLGDLVGGHTPCPACRARKISEAKMIPSDVAHGLATGFGLLPHGPYPGAHEPWSGTCGVCGSAIQPRLADLRQGTGPCPNCASHGFDPSKPAILYLLDNKADSLIKVGISGLTASENRLRSLSRRRFGLVHAWLFETGLQAKRCEQAALDELRATDTDRHTSSSLLRRARAAVGVYGGATECLDRGALSAEAALAAVGPLAAALGAVVHRARATEQLSLEGFVADG